MSSAFDAIVAQAPKLCPHCGKELRRTTVVVRGRTYHPPCYGSCGCAASQRDMNPPRVGRSFDDKCAARGIPSRFLDLDMDVSGYLDKALTGKSVYIHGDTGEGKTAIAAVVARGLLRGGRDVRMASTVKAVDDALHDQAAWEACRSAGFLVLDDLGKESDRDWAVRWMYELVNERYANGRWTCYTSNYSLPELYQRMAAAGEEKTARAILSRLGECDVAETDGWDWRAAR